MGKLLHLNDDQNKSQNLDQYYQNFNQRNYQNFNSYAKCTLRKYIFILRLLKW